MSPTKAEQKVDKSYLTSAVESLNLWGPRSTTPTPGDKATEPPSPASTVAASNDPQDHSVRQLYGQSVRNYPADCPQLRVQWFHAVDIPKRKPQLVKQRGSKGTSGDTKAKPPTAPKKFTAFSDSDSKAIEARYQRLLEDAEDGKHGQQRPAQTKVPVNEDFLFDVDIMERELAPVYWLGPVYEVRRGSWYFQEGSTNRPCEENLAAQLEEGYLKTRPWLRQARNSGQLASQRHTNKDQPGDTSILQSEDNATGAKAASSVTSQSPASHPPSHRLFGMYMNSVVTYQDANTAWISSEGMLSWVTSSVYEKLGGGAYMGGIKLTRGYAESSRPKEKEKDEKPAPAVMDNPLGLDEKQQRLLKRRSAPPSSHIAPTVDQGPAPISRESVEEGDNPHMRLHRQLSSLMESGSKDAVETEKEINRREEQVIQDDYNAQAGETQGRDIEHLMLATHGIGQLLGLRMESVNFVHDVNMMRKTFKSVYAGSEDLKALNSESGSGPGNCRVQVLPVCWRHLLEFPRRRERRNEHDVTDVNDENEYPSLEDITVEGVAFARSLISDLALDVLLYQSSYREQISKIVLEESNRIARLYKQRNPEFKGKIHLIGHSLGSAIYFDSLCRQRERRDLGVVQDPLRFWPSSQDRSPVNRKDREPTFEFDVSDFYCLGSPVGLFQMLKGRTIAGRHSPQGLPSESPLNPENMEDPFSATRSDERLSQISGLPFSVSSPKVEQLFNIFHPSDPISYRLEPLISPAMASLKPQQLPYTKKGIFGNVAPQGLTGIGAKVGQSVSDLWSNFSAGIASNILNRSLGLSNEEVARLAATPATEHPPGPGTNISAGGVLQGTSMSDRTNERKRKLADSATSSMGKTDGKDPALIDDDIETLFSKFQCRHSTETSDLERDEVWAEESRKARKMRTEEAKVRALNRNGRVDYSIQEGTLDFNPINTIASHLGYWADEDVNHFILSQLLSNKSNKDAGERGERGSE